MALHLALLQDRDDVLVARELVQGLLVHIVVDGHHPAVEEPGILSYILGYARDVGARIRVIDDLHLRKLVLQVGRGLGALGHEDRAELGAVLLAMLGYGRV